MGFSVSNATNIAQEQLAKKQQETVSKPIERAPKELTLNDTFVKEKKKNGLIERLYDGIKNLTGLGIGSKKVKAEIAKAENGEIEKSAAEKSIKDYRRSQETSAQVLGDAASIGASATTFFAISKYGKYVKSAIDINHNSINSLAKFLGIPKRIFNKLIPHLQSKKTLLGVGVGAAALAGGITKWLLLKLNRIGSQEFKVNKSDYGENPKKLSIEEKAVYKADKKEKKSARRGTNFRNFASGVLNGLMSPLILLGGWIAAPAYIIGNSLNRYFIGNKTDKGEKNLNNYLKNLKDDAVLHTAVATGAGIAMFKKGNYIKTFEKNIEASVNKLKNATLKKANYSTQTTYSELEEILLASKNIDNIINSRNISNAEKIKALTKENIFAVKFKQISGGTDSLTRALREECPPTRIIEQAQEFINNGLGNGYKISKLLGVGTIAETYLAKDKNGKEVCIKIIKEGISKEKILKDKDAFIDIIKNLEGKSKKEKEFFINNINDLANGIIKEVDLKNEMLAAEKLAKSTTLANVVKPIEVKNNIYVMEKAEGISLEALVKLNNLEWEINYYKRMAKKYPNDKFFEKIATEAQRKYDAIVERTPDFKDITLNDDNISYLIDEYSKVLTEQFHKFDKNGKVIHADIHPGNIFIDINTLKTRKGKSFTLIDTGNIVEQNAEQSLRAMNLTSYLKRANIPDLTEYVLEGASLPTGMSKEMAAEKISKELKKCFFDTETKLENMTTDSFLALAESIMKKYEIIPSNTQLNFNKAKQSSTNSFNDLIQMFMAEKEKKINKDGNFSKIEATKALGSFAMKLKQDSARKSAQESLNLKQMTPMQKLKQKNNPNNLATNSEDYLTYRLKQWKFDIPEQPNK